MTTPTTSLNQGLERREDNSLRKALDGVVLVSDRSNNPTRPVPAYFRMQQDDARLREYPYILIDGLGMSREVDREHRGPTYYDGNGYFPMGIPAEGVVARNDWPIPVMFRYQVATYARFEQHDRQLLVGLLGTSVLRPRFGALDMISSRTNPDDSVFAPDDYSVRRVDTLEGPSPQDAVDSDGKRLFSMRWTIAISSEVFISDFLALGTTEEVVLDVEQI
jgi:hypothetical protein